MVHGFQSLLRMMPVTNQDTGHSEFGGDVAVVRRVADQQRPRRTDADSLDQRAAGFDLSFRIPIGEPDSLLEIAGDLEVFQRSREPLLF